MATIHATERGRNGGHLGPGQPSAINSIEWWLTYAATRVICCSRFMRQEVLDAPSCLATRSMWCRTASTRSRGRLPGDDGRRGGDEPLLVSWGRVQYEKGFQTFVHALPEVRQEVPGVRAVVRARARTCRTCMPRRGRGGRGHLRSPASCPTTSSSACCTRRPSPSSRASTSRSASWRSRRWPRRAGPRRARRARRGHRRHGRRRAVPAGGCGRAQRCPAPHARPSRRAGRPAGRGHGCCTATRGTPSPPEPSPSTPPRSPTTRLSALVRRFAADSPEMTPVTRTDSTSIRRQGSGAIVPGSRRIRARSPRGGHRPRRVMSAPRQAARSGPSRAA